MTPHLKNALFVVGVFALSCGGAPLSAPPNEGASASQAQRPPDAGDDAVSAADESPLAEETEWLAILIDGHKSGYLKSTRTEFATKVETEVTTAMALNRLGETIPIVTVSKMVETKDGRPLRIEKKTDGAGMHQVETGIIGKDGALHLTTLSAGRTTQRSVPWPDGALMGEGQRLEAMRYGLAPGTRYTSRYFDPDLLDAIDVEVAVGGAHTIDLLGRSVQGSDVRLTMSFRGTVSDLDMVVDAGMNTLYTVSTKMGMKVEMLACTEQYALSENDPAEMIEAAFIDSPKPLPAKKRRGTIAYGISAGDANIIKTDEQTVTRNADLQTVTIKMPAYPASAPMPYSGDDETIRAALLPTLWLESDAPEIRALSTTAVGGATHAVEAARNIEHFVHAYIGKKDFSVGYASALETARSRQGDCTEHALLTAALCRAAGIPADVVFGLVYVDQFEKRKHLFGGHAWTRVYLDGRWYSLDAALDGFDTGHIALAISSGDPNDFFQIMDLIGELNIVSVK